jgi:hypothetical protein
MFFEYRITTLALSQVPDGQKPNTVMGFEFTQTIRSLVLRLAYFIMPTSHISETTLHQRRKSTVHVDRIHS